ncbi:hypothetical protein COCMIDRAFT_26595 [Bipolaris oryzae ATCC 44560]|uniref:C2H2-type domain-containing protein n=1 Tax=Bipolaris oryzae ATCC 44560 TaxID=930090 RepID=W6Z5F5_COCMI|nr:uncharacterized protein COCMIDRAFT_26595 [Bipolaris oryzae ATCC 44560]EUC45185.1 hypothetical protein COCMIDRAFT_26595 [Bipolaris oryzae ATCC 44560]
MAYNQSTHGHLPSWPSDNTRSQNDPFYQPSAVSNLVESPLQTATISEFQGEAQSWDLQTCTYATPSYEVYPPDTIFQQPIPEQEIPHSTAFPSTTYPPLRSQPTSPSPSPPSQTHFSYYQYVTTPPNHHANSILTISPTLFSLPIRHAPRAPLPHSHTSNLLLLLLLNLPSPTDPACTGPARARGRYKCVSEGCERVYARSDGLRVHVRRVHGGKKKAS